MKKLHVKKCEAILRQYLLDIQDADVCVLSMFIFVVSMAKYLVGGGYYINTGTHSKPGLILTLGMSVYSRYR